MGAAPDAYAAFYVSHRGITLAMEPERARKFAQGAGLSVIAKNSTTHYVRCPLSAFSVEGFADRLAEEADASMIRSWSGPRWDRAGGQGAPTGLPPRCPVHHYELAADGYCMGCDDVAPAL